MPRVKVRMQTESLLQTQHTPAHKVNCAHIKGTKQKMQLSRGYKDTLHLTQANYSIIWFTATSRDRHIESCYLKLT